MKRSLRSAVATGLATMFFACGALAQTVAPVRDVSGVWSGGGKGSNRDLLLQPALKLMMPWVKAKLDTSDPDPSRELFAIAPDPFLEFCDPLGVPRVLLTNTPIKIIPAVGELVMVYERNHDFREVYTDGRSHPKNLDPSWWGHSIGQWDGNTFVVDSVGFNDKTWLDWSGLAHSEALHLIERYQRIDPKTMRLSLTVDDPKAYTQSFTVQRMFTLEPWDIGEDICTHSSEQHFQQGIVQPGTSTQGK